MIDTHCHLVDDAFSGDREFVVRRMLDAGVTQAVVCCCDETEAKPSLALCSQYPGILLPTIGLHPENLSTDIDKQLATLRSTLDDNRTDICAIGEIGLDLHWDTTRIDDQIRALTTQVLWALEYDLPVIVHVRDAMAQWLDLLPLLEGEATRRGCRLRGTMHCYSGTVDDAQAIARHGDFLFGVGGTLTYKKSMVPDVARAIGIERLVVETDAPYLAPVPHRGHRNEPAYVADTVAALATILDMSIDDVDRITTDNAARLFCPEKCR